MEDRWLSVEEISSYLGINGIPFIGALISIHALFRIIYDLSRK